MALAAEGVDGVDDGEEGEQMDEEGALVLISEETGET